MTEPANTDACARSCGRRRSAPPKGCTSSTRATCRAPCGTGRTRTARAAATLLVERLGFRVVQNRIRDGRCPDCSATVPGVWGERTKAAYFGIFATACWQTRRASSQSMFSAISSFDMTIVSLQGFEHA